MTAISNSSKQRRQQTTTAATATLSSAAHPPIAAECAQHRESAAVARRHRHGVQGNGQTHCVNAAGTTVLALSFALYTPFTEYTRGPPQNPRSHHFAKHSPLPMKILHFS